MEKEKWTVAADAEACAQMYEQCRGNYSPRVEVAVQTEYPRRKQWKDDIGQQEPHFSIISGVKTWEIANDSLPWTRIATAVETPSDQEENSECDPIVYVEPSDTAPSVTVTFFIDFIHAVSTEYEEECHGIGSPWEYFNQR